MLIICSWLTDWLIDWLIDWLDTLMMNKEGLIWESQNQLLWSELAEHLESIEKKLPVSLMHTSQCFSMTRATRSFSQIIFLIQMKRGLLSVTPPVKNIAEKGKRSTGAIRSCEKRKTITVLRCVSATGVYVPPMIIFPHHHHHHHQIA